MATHPHPSDDLASVTSPEVDVQAVMAQIRATAAEKRRSGVYTEEFLTALEEPLDIEPDPAFVAGPRWREVAATAEIHPWAPLVSTRPVVGPLVIAAKRLVRRLLRWYLWPVTDQVTSHNRVVAGVLDEHSREIGRLRIEADRLRRRLADLERHLEEGR
jgi:hypothetical protein